MDFKLIDTGENIFLLDKVFNIKLNMPVIHQVIVSYRTNIRKGTSVQKNRSKVSGSNRKPWKQKGTGRARVGSVKSPIWRSGGVTFASKYKKYFMKVNKKMSSYALKMVLSELIRQSRLHIFSDFFIDKPKTKLLLYKLKKFGIYKSLIILSNIDNFLFLASRNLNDVLVSRFDNINIIDLIFYNNVIFTFKSIKLIENKLKWLKNIIFYYF